MPPRDQSVAVKYIEGNIPSVQWKPKCWTNIKTVDKKKNHNNRNKTNFNKAKRLI